MEAVGGGSEGRDAFGIYRDGAGGVAGRTDGEKATNIIFGCVVRGSVEITEGTSNTYTGGIVGYEVKAGAQITDCDVYAAVKSAGERVGGIVGSNESTLKVSRCESSSTIKCSDNVGGVVGRAAGNIWTADGMNYNNTIESCIAWFGNITATRKNENGGSSGIIVGFTGTRNTLRNCYRNPTTTLTANYCSDVYDQQNADDSMPLSITNTSGYTYIYPYHGMAAQPSSSPDASYPSASETARSLGWSTDVWVLSGSEPYLK